MKELEDMRNDELFTTVVIGIQILRDNARKQGYADGKADTPFTDTEEAEKTAYEQGLNDAWKCARKISMPENEGGMSVKALQSIFGKAREIYKCTASEAIAKIKEYEEKQKADDEIKVGDEVIVQVDRIGFVTGFDVLFDRVYVTTKDGWSDAFGRSFVKKTGRHFDAIPEVLKQMNREEDK